MMRKIAFKTRTFWVNTSHVCYAHLVSGPSLRFYTIGGSCFDIDLGGFVNEAELNTLVAALFGEDEKE